MKRIQGSDRVTRAAGRGVGRDQLLRGVLFILLLGGTALRMVLTEDLTFGDEVSYLAHGASLLSGGHVPFSDGLSYSAMYALLTRWVGDPVLTYRIGRAITACLYVVGVWFAVGRVTRSGWWALAGGALTAAVGAPYVWPGVSSFAAGFLLIGLALGLSGAWSALSSTCAVTALWIAAAARPELWPAALAGSGVSLVLNGRGLRVAKDRWAHGIAAVFAAAAPTLMLAGAGDPSAAQADRLWLAFGQHYSRGVLGDGAASRLGWEAVLAKDFPGADSMIEAAMIAPGHLGAHVLGNLMRSPEMLAATFWDAGRSPYSLVPNSVAIGLIIVFFAVGLWRLVTRGGDRTVSAWAIPAGVAAATSLAFCLLIWPRQHYLVMWVGPMVTLAVWAMANAGASARRWAGALLGVLVVVPLAFSVTLTALNPPEKPTLEAVEAIRSLPSGQVLLGDGQGTEYTPAVSMAAPMSPAEPVTTYLRRERITLLRVASLESTSGATGAGLAELASHPEDFGFEQVGESDYWILRARPE